MDRFTIQVQTTGLLTGGRFQEATEVVNRYDPSRREQGIDGAAPDGSGATGRFSLAEAHAAVDRVSLPPEVSEALIEVCPPTHPSSPSLPMPHAIMAWGSAAVGV